MLQWWARQPLLVRRWAWLLLWQTLGTCWVLVRKGVVTAQAALKCLRGVSPERPGSRQRAALGSAPNGTRHAAHRRAGTVWCLFGVVLLTALQCLQSSGGEDSGALQPRLCGCWCVICGAQNRSVAAHSVAISLCFA